VVGLWGSICSLLSHNSGAGEGQLGNCALSALNFQSCRRDTGSMSVFDRASLLFDGRIPREVVVLLTCQLSAR
jgi:hypothetical protein